MAPIQPDEAIALGLEFLLAGLCGVMVAIWGV